MENSEILAIANEIAEKHGLKASFLGDNMSVGVCGDNRSYSRVILLEGPFPGHDVWAKVSTEISNRTGINRVTVDIPPIQS